MDIGALLKTIIYLIASSLLYPVLFLLVAMAVWVVIFGGSFFAEWLERVRLKRVSPGDLPDLIRNGAHKDYVSHRVRNYIRDLAGSSGTGVLGDIRNENLLRQSVLTAWKQMDRLRMLVRMAPGFGLIGTLIPMGTGLAALGQGDMTKLSTDLVIAFTTTVVGLAVGMVAFFFYTVKRRWVEEDVKNMEMATDLLATREDGEASP